MKKTISSLLVFTLLVSMLMLSPQSIGAVEVDSESVAASSVKTRDEAVAWLRAQEGARYDIDGAYGSQCSDFTSAYVNYVLTGNPYGGRIGVYNAKEYSNSSLYPSDWQVFPNTASFLPEPGDIFVVNGADARYGHTGVVISSTIYTATIADQNGLSDWSLDYGSPAHVHDITWTSSGTWAPKYFIRPNFASSYVQPYLSVDKSSISLDLANKRTETVNVTANGSLPSVYNFSASRSSSAFDTSWGDWNGSTSPFTITAKKVGDYTIDFSLKDKTNGETVIATKTINVSVKCTHKYTLTVENPSCTSKGRTKHTCNYCGNVFYDNYTDKLEHTYGSWIITKEPTCTILGSKYRVCSSCGTKDTQEIPAVGHKYETTIVAPTAQEQGYTLHKCSVCGDSFKDNYTEPLKPSDPNAPQVVVDSKTAAAGTEVTVDVTIKNNPGVNGWAFDISYDSTVLELMECTSGVFNDITTSEEQNSNPYHIQWFSLKDDTTNGVLAQLKFKVKANAPDGEYPISITYDEDEIGNEKDELVHFGTVNGSIKITKHIPGDVNGDGKVNLRDVIRLNQHVAGWKVTVVENSTDINGDGKVNLRDVIRLNQYVAGWKVEIQ